MKLFLNFLVYFFIFINISVSKALIISNNYLKKIEIRNNLQLINNSKIGIVDFRNILKESLTMKKLGKEFLKFEKGLMIK